MRLRSGNVVVVVIPGKGGAKLTTVAIVLSIWRNQKKPQLTTQSIALGHVVAFRCVEMKPVPMTVDLFESNETNRPWVLRPESVVAILDVQESDLRVEYTRCRLTEESLQVMDATAVVSTWWPSPEDEIGSEAGLGGVYKRKRQGRKKKGAGAAGKGKKAGPAAAIEPVAEGGKKSKKKGKKKNKTKKDPATKKLKKAKNSKSVPFLPKSFKRNGTGPIAVIQTLNRLKKMEAEKFPDSSFSETDTCVITLPKVQGTPWTSITACGHAFFCQQPLVLCTSMGNNFVEFLKYDIKLKSILVYPDLK